MLDRELFRIVVANAPLVSIDLVVENAKGEILLGLRKNRPAKDSWFVPGGRVRKGESLDGAFRRLAQEELGQAFERSDAELLGLYEHFYEDSVFGSQPATHYVVLAHRVHVADLGKLPEDQHSRYRWWTPEAMRESADVHENTRAYVSE